MWRGPSGVAHKSILMGSLNQDFRPFIVYFSTDKYPQNDDSCKDEEASKKNQLMCYTSPKLSYSYEYESLDGPILIFIARQCYDIKEKSAYNKGINIFINCLARQSNLKTTPTNLQTTRPAVRKQMLDDGRCQAEVYIILGFNS